MEDYIYGFPFSFERGKYVEHCIFYLSGGSLYLFTANAFFLLHLGFCLSEHSLINKSHLYFRTRVSLMLQIPSF